MSQHIAIGPPKRWVNEHGATIELQAWEPSRLQDGRCCGRKPLEYRRSPDHHKFCTRCNRDYLPTGEQRQNWAYKRTEIGFECERTVPDLDVLR